MNSGREPRSPEPIDDQLDDLLRIGCDDPPGPMDWLIERLSRDDAEQWVVDALRKPPAGLETVTADNFNLIHQEEAQLQDLAARALASRREATSPEEHARCLFVYALAAATLQHRGAEVGVSEERIKLGELVDTVSAYGPEIVRAASRP